MNTKITSKGRVTVPKPIRNRLGISPGDTVAFEEAPDNRIVLVKVDGTRKSSKFEALQGFAGSGLSTDQIMALTRGEG